MYTHMISILFLVAQDPPKPNGANQLQVGGDQIRRDALLSQINDLQSPARLRVDYSTHAVQSESKVGQLLLGLLDGKVKGAPSTFEEYLDRINAILIEPESSPPGTLLRSGVESFDVQFTGERFLQVCVSDPRYPSFLRTDTLELAYYSSESRLDVGPHTSGLALLTPLNIVQPLPLGARAIDNLASQEWFIRPLESHEVSHRQVSGAATIQWKREEVEGHEPWLEIDVGPLPASFPYACRWFRPHSAGRASLMSLYGWGESQGRFLLTGVLHLAISGERVNLTIYRLSRFEQLPPDGEALQLATGTLRRINLSEAAGRTRLQSLNDLPGPSRELVKSAPFGETPK